MQVSVQQGAAQAALQQYAQQPARMTERERALVYARVIGVPGGADGALQPNREFNHLWLRFVSGVAQSGRQSSPCALDRPTPGSGGSLRAAARELAAQVGPLVASALGARDQWQVIDQVNEFELGGAVNTGRHRSLAQSGGAILEWLTRLGSGADAAGDVDHDLVNAAEQWLAVSGSSDEALAALSQPEAQAHRIDLATVVGKYIGETEKNLGALFDDAEAGSSVLLFDEADALFGKRTDVRDSHDRYAEPETNPPRRIKP